MKANKAYEEKLKSGNSGDQAMFALWDVEELKSLTDEGHSINRELLACIDLCETGMFEQCNVPQKLTTLRKRLLDFNKRTVHFRRTPATHIFVLMLSSDVRDRKPYALPVQCVPYAGLKEVTIRRLITRLCEAMNSYGMKVAGMTRHNYHAYKIYIFIRFRK